MKIAICGSSRPNDREVEKKTFELGRELAKSGVLVLTGACPGYPHDAVKGAYALKGGIVGVSPAHDATQHVKEYGYPSTPFTHIEFTGLGIPARNYALVSQADALIIVGGQAGTLNEFTIAFCLQKPIGVLQGSGGITRFLREISLICDKRGESKYVVFSSKPQELVSQVIELLKEQQAEKQATQ